MEGMSKGMRERMAEYSRRLEAVASGDNAGCQSRKCGNRHSRKASASSQRSWSGGSTASNGNAPSTLDAGPHGRSRQNVAAEKRQQQQTVRVQICSPALFITQFISLSITLASIFLAFSGSKIRSTTAKRIAGLALGARMSLTCGHFWAILVSDAHST